MFTMSGNDQRPTVLIDQKKGLIQIAGNSIPENVESVYKPVLNEIESYIKAPKKHTQLEFKMNYFNTASGKMIVRIINKIELIQKLKGHTVSVVWLYEMSDLDIKEIGEDYNDITTLNIQLKEY